MKINILLEKSATTTSGGVYTILKTFTYIGLLQGCILCEILWSLCMGGGAVAGEKDIVMKTQGNNELGDNKKKKITSKTG